MYKIMYKNSEIEGFIEQLKAFCLAFLNGVENRIRTDDLRITNALLYQLSYLGKIS